MLESIDTRYISSDDSLSSINETVARVPMWAVELITLIKVGPLGVLLHVY